MSGKSGVWRNGKKTTGNEVGGKGSSREILGTWRWSLGVTPAVQLHVYTGQAYAVAEAAASAPQWQQQQHQQQQQQQAAATAATAATAVVVERVGGMSIGE